MVSAKVQLWGTNIGAVSWNNEQEIAYFEYDKDFIQSGIEISPLQVPLSKQIYSFPALNKQTFMGLPGFLADSLPDKFGNALIDTWLIRRGRTLKDFTPVERLCYVGTRGMGALEFLPAIKIDNNKSKKIEIDALIELASEILTQHQNLNTQNTSDEVLSDILRVGTSAGGARAKAIIAWNKDTNEIRSGQVKASDGFSYWLLKFDGVSGNKDKELEDPKNYGLIEYAYYKMALDAGINMNECKIMQENGRNHFMTKRFDRTDNGSKIHMLSLCALQHYDFNQAGAYSYEQAFQTIRSLALPMDDIEEQFRRMAFNIIARNQDDHVKNIAFLMDRSGKWSLSPAFDMTYSYNPDGNWTNSHQMILNGKRDNFTLEDFITCANLTSMQKNSATRIINQVQEAVTNWPKHAAEVGIDNVTINNITKAHRRII